MATTRELRCPKCHRDVFKLVKGLCPHCAVKLRPEGNLEFYPGSFQCFPGRRWVHFTIWTLVVIASLGIAHGARLNRAHIDRQAAARIQQIQAELQARGGSLPISYTSSDWLSSLLDDPGYPLTREFRVVDKSKFPDDDIVHLRGLHNLFDLSFSSSRITDTGLAHLGELPHCSPSYLSLHGTNITDSGLVHLQKLKWLADLELSNTQTTDEGLVHLRRLKDLVCVKNSSDVR